MGSDPPIFGREAELRAVEDFLDAVPAGMAALRLEGDPGIGKTTLWEATVGRAADRGMRILSTRPVEAEARLSFAGLTDVLGGVEATVLRRIPPPQRHAIDVALLREEPDPGGPDQRAISMATLSILRALAEEGPLLLAVDDAQWLDQATSESLAFVARRLETEPVGISVSVRTVGGPSETFDLAVARERRRPIRVGPLSLAAIHRLIRAELDLVLPRPTLVRIEAASGGNPFYALEIARELALAGTLDAAEVPVPEDLRNLMGARIRRLPEASREALLLAAALARPTTALVPEGPLAAAEDADVIRIEPGGLIRFTHPLLASTVYERASDEHRREVHVALAGRVLDVEERARHLALGVTEPDEEVAAALDRAAEAAWLRGALHAAAGLLDLALQRTPDSTTGAALSRRLRFAESLLRVGDADRARDELDALFGLRPQGDMRGEALLASAKLYWLADWRRGVALLEEALRDATEPLLRARIHARLSWLLVGSDREAGAAHARAGLELIDEDDDPGVYAYLLLQRVWCDYTAGVADDREGFDRGMALLGRVSPWEQSPVPYMYARAHDDFESMRAVTVGALAFAREQGDVGAIAHAIATLGSIATHTGDTRRGRELAYEAWEMVEVSDVLVARLYVGGVLGTTLVQAGESAEARRVLEQCLSELAVAPHPTVEAALLTQLGALDLALGRFEEAERLLSRAEALVLQSGDLETTLRFPADLAEVVLALGDLERAERLIAELESRGRRFPRPWTRCVSRRCRGLLLAARGDLGAASETLDEALAIHGELAMPVEFGRTLLAAGQVARRARHWGPARAHLEGARAVFAEAGAMLWLERADAELSRVAGRRPAEAGGLTATEARVAELATDGLTNRQIADALFLSPKTVETHMTRIYRKLGLRSRAALAARMTEAGSGGGQT